MPDERSARRAIRRAFDRGVLRQGEQHVGVPGAIQIQALVLQDVAVGDVHPGRVDPEQQPRQLGPAGALARLAGDHRCAARAAVHPRIGQKVAVALKPDSERRGDDRLPCDRQAMQRVMKAERKSGDQHRGSNFDPVELLQQMIGCEGLKKKGLRQRRAFELQRDDVDRAGRVARVPPDRLPVPIERNRELRRHRHIIRRHMQLDLQPVGAMIARFVQYHVPARHQEQTALPLEEEAGRVGQVLLPVHCRHSRHGQQERFDHDAGLRHTLASHG